MCRGEEGTGGGERKGENDAALSILLCEKTFGPSENLVNGRSMIV